MKGVEFIYNINLYQFVAETAKKKLSKIFVLSAIPSTSERMALNEQN